MPLLIKGKGKKRTHNNGRTANRRAQKHNTEDAMIFIVEDDENIRQLEEYAIRNSGYEVKGMENGDELFAELKACARSLYSLM